MDRSEKIKWCGSRVVLHHGANLKDIFQLQSIILIDY